MVFNGYYGTIIEAQIPMPEDCYIVKTATDTGLVDKSGRKVWRHKSKKHRVYMTWDGLHGEIEVFDIKTKRHLWVYEPNGDVKQGAKLGRFLEFK